MKTFLSLPMRVRSVLKGAFLGLLSTGLVMAAAAAVVWPLWYLATAHTRVYTVLMLVAIAGALIAVAYRKIRRAKADTANVSISS